MGGQGHEAGRQQTHQGCDHTSSLPWPYCNSLLHLKGPASQPLLLSNAKRRWTFQVTSAAKGYWRKSYTAQENEARPYFQLFGWAWYVGKLAVHMFMCAPASW